MRPFGKIASSIWRSRRWRQLEGDTARLVYLYLHTSPHGNSLGAFIMPPELADLDMRKGPDKIREALKELESVNLIRLDADEEFVQIVNFFEFNKIGNRKHLTGSLKILETLPKCALRDIVAAEIVLVVYEQAKAWETTVDARATFLDEAAKLVKKYDLGPVISSPELDVSKDLLIGLSEDLLIAFPTLRQQTETKTETQTETQRETQTQRETETGGNPQNPDIQTTIRNLNRKAGQ